MSENLPYREPNLGAYVGEAGTEYDALIRGGTPFMIGADVDLVEGAANVVPSDERFSAAFRKPVVIEEVRFVARSPDIGSILGADEINVGQQHNFGGSIRCKFRVGKAEISRDPVPVSMYAPDINQDENVVAISGLSAGYGYAHFRWVLPRPLLLRPQTPMLPVFSRTRDGYGGTARVSVALAGRTLDRTIPKGIAVPLPHVGFFATPSLASTEATGSGFAVSDETAFENPFKVPLNVQRFVLRRELNQIAAGGAMVLGTPDTGQLSLRNPDMFYVVSEPTPSIASTGAATGDPLYTYARIFGVNRNLPIHRAIPPAVPRHHGSLTRKGFQAKFYNYANSLASTTALNTLFLSMIGWREEVLS